MHENSFWENRQVLVIGAKGFKGAYLCYMLANLGAQVHGIVSERDDPRAAYNLLDLKRLVDEVHTDITQPEKVADVIHKLRPSVVFHLAAKALVPSVLEDPRYGFEVNVMGVVNVLQACRKSAVERCLITSTDHVFGDINEIDIPLDVDHPLGFSGPYETSKAAAELAVRCFARTYKDELPLIALTRCANVFGPGDINNRRVIPLFINGAFSRDRTIELKYLENRRSFLDVYSAVAGYIKTVMSLDKSMCLDEQNMGRAVTYHFAFDDHGNGKPFINMTDLANLIAGYTGATVKKIEGCLDYAPNENRVLGLDCKKTRDELKWQPARPFKDCIWAMCDWQHPERSSVQRKVMLRDTVQDVMEKLLAECPRTGIQRAIQPANCPYVKRGVPCFNSVLEESGFNSVLEESGVV